VESIAKQYKKLLDEEKVERKTIATISALDLQLSVCP
jgi:hypothetical protein